MVKKKPAIPQIHLPQALEVQLKELHCVQMTLFIPLLPITCRLMHDNPIQLSPGKHYWGYYPLSQSQVFLIHLKIGQLYNRSNGHMSSNLTWNRVPE